MHGQGQVHSHTCIAHLDLPLPLPLTSLLDSVTPTGIRVDLELDAETWIDHTQISKPWS